MGYIKHDAVVVTAQIDEHIRKAHEKACELFGDMVSEIVPGRINGQVSFFIAPDGSKEGWSMSDEFDELREGFKFYLKEANGFVDYAFLRFGGDDDITSVYTGGYEELGGES